MQDPNPHIPDGASAPTEANTGANTHAADGGHTPQNSLTPEEMLRLVRLRVDGELSPEDAARLDRRLQRCRETARTHDHWLDCEQRLKSRCRDALVAAPPCPETLRQRVAALCTASAPHQHAQTSKHAERSEPGALRLPGRRSRGFSAKSMVRGPGLALLATAALVALVGVLAVQFMNARAFNGVELTTQQVAYRDTLVQEVAAHHGSGTPTEADYATLEKARQTLEARFGRPVTLPDPAGTGLRYAGGEPCALAGCGSGVRLVFESPGTPDKPAAVVSLVIKLGDGQLPLEQGVLYRLDPAACGEPGTRIFGWTQNGLLYTAVSRPADSPRRPACEQLLSAMGLTGTRVRGL